MNGRFSEGEWRADGLCRGRYRGVEWKSNDRRNKNSKLLTKEIHRFANGFTTHNGVCCWDIDHLLEQTIKGLEKVKSLGYEHCTVGIDTWAVDYVLLDQKESAYEKLPHIGTKEQNARLTN